MSVAGASTQDQVQTPRSRRSLAKDLLLFLLRRSGVYFLVLLAIVFFFVLAQMWTGSVYQPNYSFGEATLDGLEELGAYFSAWFQGNMGAQNPEVAQDVGRVVREFYPRSMALVLLAFLLATPIGVSLGAIAAFRDCIGLPRWFSTTLLVIAGLGLLRLSEVLLRGTVFETTLRWLFAAGIALAILAVLWVVVGISRWAGLLPFLTLTIAILGISVPSFLLGVILQAAVVRGYRLSAGVRILPVGGFGWDLHLVLPTLVLIARPLAQISRVTFTTLSRLLEEDFVRTARSKGAPPLQVNVRHILRNAAVPIITAIGVSLRFSLSSLPVVEILFSWPGIGYVFFLGISRTYRGDYQLAFLNSPPAVNVTILLLLGLTFILINLSMDMIYRVLDPRIREIGMQG
ncbi:MAG: ABC transporter permease [Chloroflexia bacterium]|nr:ABC transporter permease [Chloroflexia bacterium]